MKLTYRNWQKTKNSKIGKENQKIWRNQHRGQCAFALEFILFTCFFISNVVRSTLLCPWPSGWPPVEFWPLNANSWFWPGFCGIHPNSDSNQIFAIEYYFIWSRAFRICNQIENWMEFNFEIFGELENFGPKMRKFHEKRIFPIFIRITQDTSGMLKT